MIKTPDILPGETGYVSKKDRTAKKKEQEKKEHKISHQKEIQIGNIKTGSRAFRIGRPRTTPKREKKFIVWRYGKKIGEIIVGNNGEIGFKFYRFGGIGNYKNLIQDVDFQKRWAVREQELLLTQKECAICRGKISKSARPNLYHTGMWQKRAGLLEEAENVPQQVIDGKLTVEEGWKKFNDILEEGNRYYMSLQDTALICANCAKKKGITY
ncbi:MAG: hypothetical protein Q8N88_04880 [Nanoarchaeota archaeon]|nr:hypothetical protein [Nanoarchaeota archaeon]